MKRLINFLIIIISIIFFGCKSVTLPQNENPKEKAIIYVFPKEVENAIGEYLSKSNYTEVTLELQEEQDHFIIVISNSNIFWKNNSCRKAIIGSNLYPLIFDFDSIFGTAEEEHEVIERLKKPMTSISIRQKKAVNIYDNVFIIKFKQNGNILYKGTSF